MAHFWFKQKEGKLSAQIKNAILRNKLTISLKIDKFKAGRGVGTGRQDGFKIHCSQEREGSIPSRGINEKAS